ncbi:MAG: phosphate ABC transporter substrate-binding protein [Candidatus Marinimicrobia bacterium]|nr:phosphate ABC transporter substrate-binding protein [Candidatus Neomarinimicrobiota bacterium]
MKTLFFKLTTLFALTGLIFLGCSKKSNESAATQRYITVKGSDTMVHLASNWAESFMEMHPEYEISVTGGGSGTGIAALINGTTDVCIASRNIKPKEITLAKQKGQNPVEHAVARDGIAVIVNPANPVNELTLEQIGKIYTGAYSNWNQMGGKNQSIVVNSRESSSGTYVFFQEFVLNKKDYAPTANLMPSTAAIVQSVSQDEQAIGYVGLGYVHDAGDAIKVLGVKAETNSPAVPASEATILAGEYPVSRELYIYTNGEPVGLTKAFLDFMLTPEGQQIVSETGYVPVK